MNQQLSKDQLEELHDSVKLTQELVRRPSISPLDEGCQVLLKELLEQVGFVCKFINRNGVTNLWATHSQHQTDNQLLAKPVVCLAGHIDVVPIGDEKAWTYPPFSATIARDPQDGVNYLHGRGSEDMKSGVAAIVATAIKYVRENSNHPGTLAIIITSDEESIATDGTVAVVDYLEEIGQNIDYSLVAEPSSKKQLADSISIGRRGSLTGRITITGKQGHVGYPANVINPIHQLANVISLVASYQYDQGNEDFPPSSIQFVELKAGVGADNVVPEKAYCTFNIRYNNCHSYQSIQAKLLELISSFGYQVDIEWISPGLPFITEKGKLVSIAKEVIKQHLGIDAIGSTGGGTSDARFLIRLSKEVIELGVRSKTLHQVNERVAISDIETMEKIYLDIVRKLFI